MTGPIVEAERLEELRDVLAKVEGADRLPWILEIYDLRDGEEILAKSIDIRSGRAVRKRKGSHD